MANLERLEQLRRVVRDAPDDLFDMKYFESGRHMWARRCAIGWARADPWFRANTPLPSAFRRLGPFLWFDADRAARIFGITRAETWRLFGRWSPGRRRGAPARADFLAKVDKLIEANA